MGRQQQQSNASLLSINLRGIKELFSTTLPSDPKILYVDEECKSMLTCVISFSEILDAGFYAVEGLNRLVLTSRADTAGTSDATGLTNDGKFRFLSCIVICRPTHENCIVLSQVLRQPRYKDYVIIFSNNAESTLIEKLGRTDTTHSAVLKVLEMYLDFYVCRPRMFSLELPSVSRMMHIDKTCWQPYEDQTFQRATAGLTALLLSVLKETKLPPKTPTGATLEMPTVRISADSTSCSMLALSVLSQLRRLWKHVAKPSTEKSRQGEIKNTVSSTVLVLDRREDLCYPLLNPWSYQAMLHEQIGIRVNRIKVGDKDANIDPRHDTFLMTNMNKTFGEITAIAASEVKKVGATPTKESLTELLTDYSEKKRHMEMVMRHADLVHKLTQNVTVNQLLDLSMLEQRIVCNLQPSGLAFGTAQNDVANDLEACLEKSSTSDYEKFRLVALRILKLLSGSNGAGCNVEQEAQRLFKLAKLDPAQLQLLEKLRSFATGWTSTSASSEWTLVTAAKEAISRSMTQQPSNSLMQYRSKIAGIIEAAVKGSLDRRAFPQVVEKGNTFSVIEAPARADAQRVIVAFIVGGVTYEEAREVDMLFETEGGIGSTDVYIGGTCVLNSKTLLADIAQLATDNNA